MNGAERDPVPRDGGYGAAPLRCVLAVVLAPLVAELAFATLEECFRWRPIGPGLLPFDAPASSNDLDWAATGLTVLLCALRVAGVTRWRWYVGVGVVASLAAVATRAATTTLPFWLAAAAAGALTASFAWLLVRAPRRRRALGLKLVAVAGAACLIAIVFLPQLIWLGMGTVRNLRRSLRPTPDGGTIATYSWTIPGFLDTSFYNRVLYTPPGWWSRAEPIAELLPSDHLTGFAFVAEGDRRAVALETTLPVAFRPAWAAKRVMDDPQWWLGNKGPPRALRPRWLEPRLELRCLWRAFEPPGSRAGEPMTAQDPWRDSSGARDRAADVDRSLPTVRCTRPGRWRAASIDLANDRFTEVADDLPPSVPRTVVYTSREYHRPWVSDLELTLAANPAAHPLPLPPMTAVVTVVQIPRTFAQLPADKRLDSLLAVDGARIACLAEAPLRQLEAVELRCDTPTLAAPTSFVVTGLWGDPNPDVAAVAVTESWGRRYLLQPFDRDVGFPAFYGNEPIETVFLRLRRSE